MNNTVDKKFNAIKHGLLAKQVVISTEESRPFNKIAKKLINDLQPVTATEMILAEQVIINYWRLRRYLKLENELFVFINKPKFGIGVDDFMSEFTGFIKRNPSLDVLNRYSVVIYKQFYRSLHEYQNMKSGNNLSKQEEN